MREEGAVLRDACAVNEKVRLLTKPGTALIKTKADGAAPSDGRTAGYSEAFYFYDAAPQKSGDRT